MAALYLLLGFAAQTRPDGKCGGGGGGASERARRGGQGDGKDLDILTEADASSPAGCGMASRRI